MQEAAQCLIHTKSGVAYIWIAGLGPHAAVQSADLMEFACHLSRDEAMDLARRIFTRIDELAPKVERRTRTLSFVDYYDLETIEPLKEHMAIFEQGKEELAKLGVEPAGSRGGTRVAESAGAVERRRESHERLIPKALERDAEMSASEIARLIGDLDNQAISAVEKALREGENPVDLLQQGVIRGLELVGEKFESQDYFLPELVAGGKITETCIDLIHPHLPRDESAALGVVVIGAVQGDFHDLGYGLVAKQLALAGFEVHQLGVDIPPMTFIDKAQELNAHIIGLSAFLLTTIPKCNIMIDYLRDMGLRDRFQVIIGGAQTSQEAADEMGADGWAPNAVEAVRLCRNLMDQRGAAASA
jgi:5-methyltetrahydrofolate--homocysteine methyltransferase